MADVQQTQDVLVKNPHGLHIRPASIVATEAMRYESQITLELEGYKVDAKAALQIMTLGAREGSTITVAASGADAQQAVQKIAELIGGYYENDDHDQSATQDQAG
ncbi:Phosphocarrier protein HPr [Posidoniimonas corsicana]|uniref:Phosphocarrier protein HPr n=1 Tax=Posidoniimonas corsicana TaxID=1938618 RepID=A0A5C5UVI0_9BACT|nr:HPr family phosphocarrier protein [Posidoniimonas corsicana]TWT30416.1 Phosphocarrier protein HPr [Posidoniimonas corsicana]